MSSHLERLGSQISVSIKPDGEGYLGRECPEAACLGYFKIKPGTGLSGQSLPCHCPYCGHTGPHNTFWTQEQIEYAKSVAFSMISDAMHADVKALEVDYRPRGGFGIGISVKVKRGERPPIHHYREKRLETLVVCEDCTLEYAIYGVFAFCPDCGVHNSLHILNKNLELVRKVVTLAQSLEADIAEHLIGNALEDAVSAFDGFGRELSRVHAARALNPGKAANLSFQNLNGAWQSLLDLYGFDMAGSLSSEKWEFAVRCFQKRHLLAHSMGVVDDKYMKATSDASARVGRKVSISPDEVAELASVLQTLGSELCKGLAGGTAAAP